MTFRTWWSGTANRWSRTWWRRGPRAGYCHGVKASMPKIADGVRAARRDQIITAAFVCFARTGYHATTMADVAEQAGVSKGTPYLYFESKQELFIVLHEQWDCGLADRVNAEVAALPEAGRRSPRRVLRGAAAAVASHILEDLRRAGC